MMIILFYSAGLPQPLRGTGDKSNLTFYPSCHLKFRSASAERRYPIWQAPR